MNRVTFEPTRWVVQISVTCSLTGKAILIARHDCRDRHHAATLLTEMRELAVDLREFLPGLTASGYELAPAVLVPEPEPLRNALRWAEAIQRERGEEGAEEKK